VGIKEKRDKVQQVLQKMHAKLDENKASADAKMAENKADADAKMAVIMIALAKVAPGAAPASAPGAAPDGRMRTNHILPNGSVWENLW
jgi:hypothetical protein